MSRPAVFVTRRVPSSVVERLEQQCTVQIHDGPEAIPADELGRALPTSRR